MLQSTALRIVTRSTLLVLAAHAGISAAQSDAKLDCPIAKELAVKAYKRVVDEKNKKNFAVAELLSKGFWDIHGYSAHCRDVVRLGEELKAPVKIPVIAPLDLKTPPPFSGNGFSGGLAGGAGDTGGGSGAAGFGRFGGASGGGGAGGAGATGRGAGSASGK